MKATLMWKKPCIACISWEVFYAKLAKSSNWIQSPGRFFIVQHQLKLEIGYFAKQDQFLATLMRPKCQELEWIWNGYSKSVSHTDWKGNPDI